MYKGEEALSETEKLAVLVIKNYEIFLESFPQTALQLHILHHHFLEEGTIFQGDVQIASLVCSSASIALTFSINCARIHVGKYPKVKETFCTFLHFLVPLLSNSSNSSNFNIFLRKGISKCKHHLHIVAYCRFN